VKIQARLDKSLSAQKSYLNLFEGLILGGICYMLGNKLVRRSVTSVTLVAVWCVYSMVAFAMPQGVTGSLTATGQVTVNGQPAVSNSTVTSGAVITTAKASSAVVSLGKVGRVEIQEGSSVTLRFSDNSITASLEQGPASDSGGCDMAKIRIASSAGVAATVTTKHGTVISDSSQADNFTVSTECSQAHVDTVSGVVTLREGSSDKRVAAGSSAAAGNLNQTGCKPCLRPNSGPQPAIGNWPWLLLLAAGAAGVGIWLSTRDNNNDIGGSSVIASPSR
jgi:hypothetical protein